MLDDIMSITATTTSTETAAFVANGYDGRVEIHEESVAVVKRPHIGPWKYGSGVRTDIPFDRLTGVTHKEPSLMNGGIIQVREAGHESANPMQSVGDRRTDNHTIRYKKDDAAAFEELHSRLTAAANE